METIRITINGRQAVSRVEARLLLVQYLRNVLGLYGARVGCDTNQCGACTVLLDDVAVKSCSLFAVQADGSRVETIEGFGVDAGHPLQRAFRDEFAVQCGFCTPGMILGAEALLRRNAAPTESEIRRSLDGNLCRCSGYDAIVRAIQSSGAQSRSRVMSDDAPANMRLPERREDARFVTGRARFTDDIVLPDLVHAVFVRSPHTHARIRGIDAQRALERAGVIIVCTGTDLDARGVKPIPAAVPFDGCCSGERRAIATDRIRYEGEAAAMVVAESAHLARDAVDHIEVDYEPVQAIADALSAQHANAPRLYDDAPGNVAFDYCTGDATATERAFAASAHVIKLDVRIPRTAAVPIEPPVCIAAYEPTDGTLVVYATTQAPHLLRRVLAHVLGLAEHRIRVIARDVGGAFGARISLAPEVVAVCHASIQLGRPVKWTGVRREAFAAEGQGRDHVTQAALALDADGRILAMRVHTLANLGANCGLIAALLPTHVYSAALSGPYAVPALDVRVTGVFTNTTPVDAVRGSGRQEATYTRERLLDVAAHTLGIDPIELRLRNLTEETTVSRAARATLERAVQVAEIASLRTAQESARGENRLTGIGVCTYSDSIPFTALTTLDGDSDGAAANEWAETRVLADGSVVVSTSGSAQGQGHETAFAMIAAETLGIPVESVTVAHGDTRAGAGTGTFFCRGASVTGEAVRRAAMGVRDKAASYAAHLLGTSVDEIEIAGNVYCARGASDRSVTLATIARRAGSGHEPHGDTAPDLVASVVCWPDAPPACGTHVALVEIDGDTGSVTLARYVAVDEVGRRIHPRIVDGMIAGGITHGVGQALWECVRREENGQLLSSSLMEYALPRAIALPAWEISVMDGGASSTKSGDTGSTDAAHDVAQAARGVGTVGAIAAPAALANAVVDALRPLGITHIDGPLQPHSVWGAMQSAKASGD